MLPANNPKLRAWIDVDSSSDFPIQNLPFGIFKTQQLSARVGTAIGNYVLDLASLANLGYLDSLNINPSIFHKDTLNPLISLGKAKSRALRQRISDLLNAENAELKDAKEKHAQVLIPQSNVEMLMPVFVRDYTDFYSSIEHATNIGTMFRGKDNALMPNWKHLPVGYHGRASSIVVSGTAIHRPKGQQKPNDDQPPVYGASKLLDFELEMGFIIGKENGLGNSITTDEADDYIFGLVVFNDWSARDIQKWEYVPLGPFLGKNFASSISPWVVTLDALEPFRVAGPEQDSPILPYLQFNGNKNLDIHLEVQIEAEGQNPQTVCRSNHKYLYWNMEQQLAHHTVNGCNMNVGDILASGTISGPTEDSYGSMLELSWRGTKPLPMPDGSERKFILDGDSVIMKAHAEKDGVRVGFGEVRTKVLPAK